MRQLFLAIAFFGPFISYSQNGLYDLKFSDYRTGNISISEFKGKKILIIIVDASDPDLEQMRSLDTLYKSSGNALAIIAIPVTDVKDSLSNKPAYFDFSKSGVSYPIASLARAKKAAGDDQHLLLKWLTNKERNLHFDREVEEEGQMYIINEQGAVYAMMKRKVSATGSLMKKLLSQQLKN